jgi:biofilm protein TabA
MIIDRIEQIGNYAGLGSNFVTAAEFMAGTDLAALENGKHEVDGDNVFVIAIREPGKTQAEARLEAHRNYADIQVVLAGTDTMGWKARALCVEPDGEYDAEKDLEFFKDASDIWVPIGAGTFALFLPDDVHAPMVSDGEIHKVVVKVKLSS